MDDTCRAPGNDERCMCMYLHLRIDKKLLSKWILRKYYMVVWTGFSWLRIRIAVGYCEDVDRHSSSLKVKKRCLQLSIHILLNRDTNSWNELLFRPILFLCHNTNIRMYQSTKHKAVIRAKSDVSSWSANFYWFREWFIQSCKSPHFPTSAPVLVLCCVCLGQ
jgi:hypothetical protein